MPPPADYKLQPFLLRKLGASVFPEIASGVFFFTAVAVVVSVACKETGYSMQVSTVMLSVITSMLSFAVSLRTSSAVERFGEGRKAWSQITRASRDFAFLVWLHIPPTTLTAAELASMKPEDEEMENVKGLIEKRTIINLVQGFSVACKHYLRGESGVWYEDLYDLIACLPRYSFPSSVIGDVEAEKHDRETLLGIWRSPGPDGSVHIPYDGPRRRPTDGSITPTPAPTLGSTFSTMKGSPSDDVKLEMGLTGDDDKHSQLSLWPASNPPEKNIYDYMPPLVLLKPILRFITRTGKKKRYRRPQIESNIPLEISLFLSGYVSTVIRRKTLDAPYVSVVFASLNALQDSVTTLERVLTTPLPWAYQAHLRATTWFFLFFLPFQIYSSMGYLTIVGTFVASCIFLGFLELGTQLENPFGYDDSDLDLDHFCDLLAAELREIVAHPQISPSSFVFSNNNMPFQPADTRSAPEILADVAGVEKDRVTFMRKMMMKHFNDHSPNPDHVKGSKRRVGKEARSINVFSV